MIVPPIIHSSFICTLLHTLISLSKFAGLHPGGEGVLYDATVAGKDATAVFFGLHRAAVLEKYARLIIGQVCLSIFHKYSYYCDLTPDFAYPD